jgi:hypothetical protein
MASADKRLQVHREISDSASLQWRAEQTLSGPHVWQGKVRIEGAYSDFA